MAATEQQFGLLGLTEAQLASLLDELDNACRDTIINQKRRSVRKPFRSVNVKVSLLDKSVKQEVTFKVPTRNISLHGLAFLHHHMLQVDQMLRVQIPFKEGYTVEFLARVARCRHIRGMIHEIGVEFKGKLNRRGIPDTGVSGSATRTDTAESPSADG